MFLLVVKRERDRAVGRLDQRVRRRGEAGDVGRRGVDHDGRSGRCWPRTGRAGRSAGSEALPLWSMTRTRAQRVARCRRGGAEDAVGADVVGRVGQRRGVGHQPGVGGVLADGHDEVAGGVGQRGAGVEPVEDAVALGRDVEDDGLPGERVDRRRGDRDVAREGRQVDVGDRVADDVRVGARVELERAGDDRRGGGVDGERVVEVAAGEAVARGEGELRVVGVVVQRCSRRRGRCPAGRGSRSAPVPWRISRYSSLLRTRPAAPRLIVRMSVVGSNESLPERLMNGRRVALPKIAVAARGLEQDRLVVDRVRVERVVELDLDRLDRLVGPGEGADGVEVDGADAGRRWSGR